jgi:hypothetical protein
MIASRHTESRLHFVEAEPPKGPGVLALFFLPIFTVSFTDSLFTLFYQTSNWKRGDKSRRLLKHLHRGRVKELGRNFQQASRCPLLHITAYAISRGR